MTNHEDFGSVQAKMVGASLLLYPVLCLPSFLSLLQNAKILPWEKYYEVIGSSFIQNVYFSEFYQRLSTGWLLMLVIVPIIVAFSVASWKERGRAEPGDRMTLSLKLIAMNALLMAILAPMTLVSLIYNVGLLSADAFFAFLDSTFIEAIYGHEFSWIYMVLPFLIIGPIILAACARSWYQPAAAMRLAPTSSSGVSDPSRY